MVPSVSTAPCGAVDFQARAAGLVGNAEEAVDRGLRAGVELQQRRRGVFRAVILHQVARHGHDAADGAGKILDQIVEVRGHVDQRAASALSRVLPPRALDLRIPARQLGPQIDDLAEPALVDQLLDPDVRPVELHHVAFLEEHAPAAAEGHGLPGLIEAERQRLLAEDVLARLGGQLDLPGVAIGRRGDVDRFDLRVGQQVGFAAIGPRDVELGGHALGVDRVHDRHQAAVLRLEHSGNRAAAGDAAGADHAKIDLARVVMAGSFTNRP